MISKRFTSLWEPNNYEGWITLYTWTIPFLLEKETTILFSFTFSH